MNKFAEIYLTVFNQITNEFAKQAQEGPQVPQWTNPGYLPAAAGHYAGQQSPAVEEAVGRGARAVGRGAQAGAEMAGYGLGQTGQALGQAGRSGAEMAGYGLGQTSQALGQAGRSGAEMAGYGLGQTARAAGRGAIAAGRSTAGAVRSGIQGLGTAAGTLAGGGVRNALSGAANWAGLPNWAPGAGEAMKPKMGPTQKEYLNARQSQPSPYMQAPAGPVRQ